ncbi:Similar to USP2: Ubiquitin carboxyl-terminal hydrolase 2 (Gallus gallus) [Cotesia congregata]|uniref:ubiquitinyl hydrolase 1 n=1 Tax=Cotesia congregata TaxID=51543 RepID=A0A8J2MRC4_COTCN|nr:Similar to USP2: Ubiquitin carboxyl-terminal hydrolase 2 (Gallus gallus) [Cotesia congregata]
MSIHRGGPPGAVAVTYNSMAPLSPTRRYSSSSTGPTTSSGTTTTKFNSCRSSKALEHMSYSAAATSTTCLSGARKNYYSPARSVSSYSEAGSVSSAASKLSPKFSSTSTSSASSTASSVSSSNNRDRYNNLSASNNLTDSEFRSKYSPDNYIPTIYRSNGSNSSLSSNSSTLNGHCKSFPTSSSTSGLAELHGGDERDSIGYREQRDRSYSNETTNSLIGGDRWAVNNRHTKRRNNPTNTLLTGHDQIDSAAAPTEVTHHQTSSSSSSLEQDHDSNIIPDIARNNILHHGNNVNNKTAIAVVDNDNNNANNNNDHDRQQQYSDDQHHRSIINNHNDRDYDDNYLNHHGHPTLAGYTQRSYSSVTAATTPAVTTTTTTITTTNTATTLLLSSSPSSSSLSSSTTSHQLTSPVDSPASESYNSTTTTPLATPIASIASVTDNYTFYNTLSSTSATSGDGGGSAAPADNRACSWTKKTPPTNPDNSTELVTNNNDQENSNSRNNPVLKEPTTTGAVFTVGDPMLGSLHSSILSTHLYSVESSNSSTNWMSNDNNDYQQQQRLTSKRDVTNNSDDGFDGIRLELNEYTDDSPLDNNKYLENVKTNSIIEKPQDNNPTRPAYSQVASGFCKVPVDLNTKVTSRPLGTLNDDSGKASNSKTPFDWQKEETLADGARFNPSSSSAGSSTLNPPVGVHQGVSRGINDQIEESSSSRPPRSSRIPTRRDENYGLNGLRNIGNTCFMNSVIQCLSNTKPLLEYLLNEQYLNDINQTTSSMKGALIKAFAQVINELWESSGDHVVNTSSLKNQIQRFAPRFMGYAQQDAQEFLRYLLEGLHEDVNRVAVKPQPILADIPDHFTDSQKATESWKRYLRSEDSTIVDVFVGQLRSSLQCTSCDHISVTLDPFWDLSLPIPTRSGTVKLNQCLEHFTKTEIMDGDEKPTCSKCQMRRKCTKRFSIQKFPKILVIHLKRFSPTERFRSKLSVLVDFPLMGLDLSAFAATGVQGCTYNLYGVANHSGTPYSGHYTAYCKHPYSGEWHEYNDSRVSSVSASSVISSEAYVLFYEQQSQSQQQQQPLSHHL